MLGYDYVSFTAYYFHIPVPLQCYCLESVYYLGKCWSHEWLRPGRIAWNGGGWEDDK